MMRDTAEFWWPGGTRMTCCAAAATSSPAVDRPAHFFDRRESAGSPFLPGSANLNHVSIPPPESASKQRVQRRPPFRIVALQSIGEPWRVGGEQQVQVAEPLSRGPFDPGRTG